MTQIAGKQEEQELAFLMKNVKEAEDSYNAEHLLDYKEGHLEAERTCLRVLGVLPKVLAVNPGCEARVQYAGMTFVVYLNADSDLMALEGVCLDCGKRTESEEFRNLLGFDRIYTAFEGGRFLVCEWHKKEECGREEE